MNGSQLILFFCCLTLVASQPGGISDEIRPSQQAAERIEEILQLKNSELGKNVFISEGPDQQFIPSTIFQQPDFEEGLRTMYETGVVGRYFYLGTSGTNGHLYGIANIAAFLAQVMKESIRYNACDENNWDLVNNQYPISNSCGQLNQNYQDYSCPAGEEFMQCDVDPGMTISATTHATWYGAPGPLYCGPKTLYPFTGYWDHTYECNKPWADPPELCTDYEGQKAGREVSLDPVANRNGRIDVEGCCWWGRGAIQTSGVCNYGRLNYYLGKRAADEGRISAYPTIDFCRDPGSICNNKDFPDLKWVAGLFYWIDSVQKYDVGGWNYLKELHKFVDTGMIDSGFIDAVSGIVNRGCHNPPCASGAVDGTLERRENFQTVMDIIAIKDEVTDETDAPTQASPAPVSTTSLPTKLASTLEPTISPSHSTPSPTAFPTQLLTTVSPTQVTPNPTESESTTVASSSPTSFVVSPSAPDSANMTISPVAQATAEPTSVSQAPTDDQSSTFFPIENQARMCCMPGETSLKPINGCQSFYSCNNGVLISRAEIACQDGLLFDQSTGSCNWSDQVLQCDIDPCNEPTQAQTESPTVTTSNVERTSRRPSSANSQLTKNTESSSHRVFSLIQLGCLHVMMMTFEAIYL